ncbi:uncharacterized protein Z520_03676 [Fonsecaea multimorphosa CBS 102226]|uniref:NADH-ubiquinone oxidoreductase 29.9 kDa subunit, mitochondrial n=1 Tax=Fonsecaea multimorphosa CBS 102226 TaxID=1442371 RepID=A0A0D2KCW0_9EURO|nr:uncharacterized protein Z520_03676 [Fonsecaea multimorphosa CBS 102226]KIY01010.1 hypothetical protein Z520_03676 [Fonsecaea multimorphosa CBS 102226]OAL27595.1 hypothetical protein AYO22_03499 [Fonsecaea multimorphosa]
MRATSRLFATVRSASKYLEPNTPTGLTGLTTHPSPRPALIYTYRQTLNKLAQLPKSSVYRQSAEAFTKQRLQVVESVKPEGYEQWLERVRKQIEASPTAFSKLMNEDGSLGSEKLHVEAVDNWDGKISRHDAKYEGPNTMAQAEAKARAVMDEVREKDLEDKEGVQPTVEDLEVEPPLTREQIESIEQKIGAGLIEEVIQVAEGELDLVAEMLRYQVWDDLEEKTPTGQWEYFERGNRV